MKMKKSTHGFLLLIAILGISFIIGCSMPAAAPSPAVTGTIPDSTASSVAINGPVTATFNKAMDPATIGASTFAVVDAGGVPVTGTVTYDAANKTAIFTPTDNLDHLTKYTATVTTGVTDLPSKALGADKAGKTPKANKVWTFKTAGIGPAPVNLGTAGNFVILAKTAVSTVPASAITGDVGLSPATTAALTGFSPTLVGTYATSSQVTGKLYGADMTSPTPSTLTTAILDMQTAYTDAAGRPTPDFLNMGAGNIGGLTLVPGLYKWGSTVLIPANVTLAGAANDVWIFQISNDLTVSSAVKVLLSGGAQAKNVYWQLAGIATLGTTSHFEGIILSKTQIIMQTGATMNGRALAQTQVTLDHSTVTKP